MSTTDVIEHITTFADQAHGEQVRKYTGERYIVHPIRVMEMTKQYNSSLPVLAAALLHDVLEDTPVTADEVRLALMKVMNAVEVSKAMQLVVELTDVFVKQNYPGLNRRTRKEKEALRLSKISADAQTIKYADIIDNVRDIVTQDTDFAKVYVREARKMLTVMEDGNPGLRQKAVRLVEDCLYNLHSPQIS
jgi:(p)ppGpp synthase/HD superfamily hydrolase